jgi:hypothetical protein
MCYTRMRSVLTLAQEQAKDYMVTEDWQATNCLRPFVEEL